MKVKVDGSEPINSNTGIRDHFSLTEIKRFTSDLVEQQVIKKFGLICPSCSLYMLKNYCPDCGRKTIIPNFCYKCKIESNSQFCEKCGTAIFETGMDTKKFEYLSGNDLEKIIIKLVSLSVVPSDYQIQMFSLGELELQTLIEIKKEITLFSKRFNKLDERMESIDSSIYDVETELRNSITILNGNISEMVNRVNIIDKKVSEAAGKVNEINNNLSNLDRKVDDIDSTVNHTGNIDNYFELSDESLARTKKVIDSINEGVNFIIKNGVYNRRLI